MFFNRLNHSHNVNQYLAMTLRKLAMGEEQTRELADLEHTMDELWHAMLNVEHDEVNEIVAKAWASMRAEVRAAPSPTVKDSEVFSARDVPVATIGRAFREVMSEQAGHHRAREKPLFVSMILDALARLPDLAPSDEEHGKAFLQVLRDPKHTWGKTPAWPFILLVAEKAAVLDAHAKLQARDKASSLPTP